MIQGPLDAAKIAVLVQQLDGVDLAEAVGPNVLRQAERLGGALHVAPNGLSGLVPLGAARKGPHGPGLGADIGQQGIRKAHSPALLGLGFRDHELPP